MTVRKTTPEGAIMIRTYEELTKFVRAFSSGHLNLLIIVGRAGVAKSQTVRQSVGAGTCWIEGNATAFGIYTKLYRYRDQLLVIDDVDSLYSDRAAVRLLKCICQTDPVKSVAWNTAAVGGGSEDIPRDFQTSSRVCIIANDWKTLDANTAAVQDRGHLVIFDPTPEEVHRQVAEWFWDADVFAWLGEHLHLIPNLSMRHYVRATELKKSNLDWVRIILADALSEKLLLLAKLRADTSFKEERDRVAAFRELGGGGKTTYFKLKKELLRNAVPSLNIDLKNAQSDERAEPTAFTHVQEAAA